jgi:hypothetical protein
MTFTLADWLVYTIWAVFGLMFIDLLIGLFKSFWKGSFDTSFLLDYLKDILYYVFPLTIILDMTSIDPTSWILVVAYFVFGLAIVIKYLKDIIKRFS